jgi:hypothetical protein
MVHGDCSSAAFFTMPSRLLAIILPFHCTRAPLAGYRSSPPGRPCLPVAPCFVSSVFRKLFPSVSSVCYVCCNGYVRMLQLYISSVSYVCLTCFICIFHVFSSVCFICFILMLQKDLMLHMLQ